MAGKSNKSKNRGRGASTTNSSKQVPSSTSKSVDSSLPLKDNSIAVESIILNEKAQVSDIGDKPLQVDNSANAKLEGNESTSATSTDQSKQANGDVHLYPVSVKTQSGEKLELHLNPGDSVMDLRQFLLDAPETCYLTCYDLLLHTKDGSIHHLEDYNEISEVGDITTGGCSLEMVAALYDDRSIRSHFRRARELLSFSSFHSSLSTSLALQHEMTQNKTEDSTKVEFLDLERVGFMEDVTDSLSNLVSSPSSKEIKCVESLVFSSFNPPPTYRRLVGDLIYLDVVTLEGNKYCITGSTRTFYVNSSSGSVLDPRPAKSALEATTLIGLLQKLSAKFKKGFREILDRKAAAHPFENAQFLLPANSWLGVYPVPDHKRDAGRAEDALTLSYGSELIGMQRDWNDELQSCREFSNKTLQERILRDRALYKVTCDFVDAATSGAVGVINKSIPPINPTDPECFHMYVHNNVFFSFAVDADLGQMSKNNPSIVSVKIQIDPEHNENDSSLSKSSEMFCRKENGSEPHSQNCDGSITEFHEATDVASNKSPEAQVDEQTTYASANNDLKGTKAFQEADVPGLYNLAMAIVDYRGYRVVAQSIIPGILQGDKSESLLYGSVDNGKKICWNEEFHLKVLEAAKRLHLKEHTVLDGSGNPVKLAAPVECKGIVGSDGRYYLLDLMRITPQDTNYSGPSSKSCVLRPELVTAYCQVEASDRSKPKTDEEVPSGSDSRNSNVDAEVHIDSISPASSSKDATEEDNGNSGQECNSVPGKSSKLCEEILLNPNVFTEFKLADTQEEIAADEEGVRKASKYLVDVVLPKFVQDLCLLEVSPMDGRTLTEALHAHGVNVRYIGQVAEMTKHFPHIWDQCVTEIVVRSAKHIIKDVLRESLDHELGLAISHIFNCFFGNTAAVNSPSRNQKKDQSSHQFSGRSLRGSAKLNHRTSSRKDKPAAYMHISSEGLWSDIHEFAKFKYQFELPEDVRPRLRKISAIRNLCQKVGIVISARKYDLEAAAPFQISDILNIQPVVKHSVPVCSEARDLMETGKVKLSEGKLNEAYTLFSEAFSILQQVTGPMHREVANCCRYLAMVLYHAGDMAGAIMQQHKELIINERCLGLDHPDTAHSYSNMALFYHGLNQTDLALRHMSRTLVLLSLSCGPDHPDVAATFINLAMMYQDLGKMDKSLRYLQEALKKNEQLLGPEHIQTAVCYHAMAIAFNSMQIYHKSLEHEKRTYNILVKQLGKEDPRTRESQNWINAFEMHNQVNAQKQKRQVVNAANTQQAIDMLKANQQLLQAFAAGGSGNADSSGNKSLSSTLIRETLPRGRGVDERAARAVAEVRKKAEARGLLLRPRGGPVQALLPVAQLLNIINSGMTSEVQKDPKADKPKNEVNGTSSTEGTLTAIENGSVVTEEAQAPVGLGTSLASLDSKKQKPKAKVTA